MAAGGDANIPPVRHCFAATDTIITQTAEGHSHMLAGVDDVAVDGMTFCSHESCEDSVITI